MKNTAGEVIMSIKKDNGSLPANWNDANIYSKISQVDRFAYSGGPSGVSGTNIDLVFIPDLLVAALQRVLPALTKLDK